MGKEIAVFAWRLERVASQIEASEYLGKFSGATGTWSAHLAADPDVAWPTISREFIESLGLGFNPLTTQIESHDWQVELYDRVAARRRHPAQPRDRHLDLHLARLLRADPASRARPDRRRCRTRSTRSGSRTPRRTSRSPAACSRPLVADPRHLAPAARPHRLDDAAQHRRRVRALAARARQPAARASARSRSAEDVLAGRPRRQLGGARRGDPDGRARRDRRRALARSPTRTPCSRSSPAAGASARPSWPSSSAGSRSAMPRRRDCSRSPRPPTSGVASDLVDGLD